jgi:hypothetical protein
MEWKRTGEDDAAGRAHGFNEAQPLRLLWSTSPERRPKSPESPTQLGFNPQAVRLQVAPPPVANAPSGYSTN